MVHMSVPVRLLIALAVTVPEVQLHCSLCCGCSVPRLSCAVVSGADTTAWQSLIIESPQSARHVRLNVHWSTAKMLLKGNFTTWGYGGMGVKHD